MESTPAFSSERPKFVSAPKARPKTLVLGESVDRAARGNFFFLTNAQPPYAKETPALSTNCSRVG